MGTIAGYAATPPLCHLTHLLREEPASSGPGSHRSAGAFSDSCCSLPGCCCGGGGGMTPPSASICRRSCCVTTERSSTLAPAFAACAGIAEGALQRSVAGTRGMCQRPAGCYSAVAAGVQRCS